MAQQTAEAPKIDVRDAPPPAPLTGAGAVVWVLVEIAFVLHGWPGVPRYLFEPVAIACVLAGIAVGRVILDLPPLLARVAPRLSPSVIGWGTGIVVLRFLATWTPGARSRLHIEKADSHVTTAAQRARCHGIRMTYRS